METLAYLYGAEDYEQSEAKELNLNGLKTVVTTGLLAAGVAVAGTIGTADSASAYGYGYGYGSGYYGGCYRSCYPSYYRPIYYPHYYHAYPTYYGSYYY
jgi:hypothetical protein